MNYYKRHLGDYAKKTKALTVYEHGVYSLLLDSYYADESPIPTEDAYNICSARNKEERASVTKVLRKFFTERDGAWHNDRADEEIAKYHAKAAKNAESGSLGGIAKAQRNASETLGETPSEQAANDVATRAPVTTSHKSNNHEKAKTAARKSALPADFALTDRIRAWALERGHDRLEERFEEFVSYAKRSAARYADWEEAFMTSVRRDWARFNGLPENPRGSNGSHQQRPRSLADRAAENERLADEQFGPL